MAVIVDVGTTTEDISELCEEVVDGAKPDEMFVVIGACMIKMNLLKAAFYMYEVFKVTGIRSKMSIFFISGD